MLTLIAIICVFVLAGIALYAIEHRQEVVIYYEKEGSVNERIEQNRNDVAAHLGKII